MKRIVRKSVKGIALFGGSLLIMAGATLPALASDGGSSIEVDALVPEFTYEQNTDDLIPPELGIIEQANLDSTSSRRLASSSSGLSWVAQDKAGNICLVTRLSSNLDVDRDDQRITGASCATPTTFYHHGSSLRLEGANEAGMVAHILPERVEEAVIDRSIAALKQDIGVELAIEQSAPRFVVLDLDSADLVGDISITQSGDDEPVIALPSLSSQD